MEDGSDAFYPCHGALGAHLIEGLMRRSFDITAVKALVGEQFEGHAYSFIHRRFMRNGAIPMVPVFLNTYYPPNQPAPQRCFELGKAVRELVAGFADDIRVGILASGGLSHFLVNEELDHRVVAVLRGDRRDYQAAHRVAGAPAAVGIVGDSGNWITVAAAAIDLRLDWISYVPGYRSRALTGVGLCFASWR